MLQKLHLIHLDLTAVNSGIGPILLALAQLIFCIKLTSLLYLAIACQRHIIYCTVSYV